VSDPRQIFSTAVAHHREGRLDEAAKLYEQVLKKVPNQVDCLHLLGVLSTQRGDFKAAIELISRAIEQKKSAPVAEFHNNIGAAYKGLGDLESAGKHFATAARLKPTYAEAFNNLGSVQERTGVLDDAEANFNKALALKPDYAKAHCGLGNIALSRGSITDAITHFEKAIEIEPNFLEAHGNLGRALTDLGRLDEAEDRFRYILSLDPDNAAAHYGLGVAEEEKGDPEGALTAYQKAISLAPDEPDFHWNAGLVHLLKGSYEAGWQEYEWRLKRAIKLTRNVDLPRWDGGDISGKTILIQTEQGYGDTFQFIRYAQLLKDKGARVIVECQPKTEELIARASGVDEVISRESDVPKCDLRIELLSLPKIFGTTVDQIPATLPYIKPPRPLKETWAERFVLAKGKKVGVVWRGNPLNTINPKKSVPIGEMAYICAVKGVHCFAIQLDASAEEIAALNARAHVGALGEDIFDWSDTASLIDAMDLIISVDTGVAHLAGALGKPTWVMLADVPDWRWMLDREDSPWYPGMRLFRQAAAGDWRGVTERVRKELAAES